MNNLKLISILIATTVIAFTSLYALQTNFSVKQESQLNFVSQNRCFDGEYACYSNSQCCSGKCIKPSSDQQMATSYCTKYERPACGLPKEQCSSNGQCCSKNCVIPPPIYSINPYCA
ncbi:transmembrane protein, putative (macronuclear) [Tetrahymena thermophila SB210]|uniref:Transmembrane protein, putative n=1 Tax=Tetrahymena thermophila (strain SB210) TaxID=312017 RepID=I7MJI8_TETTS|nr:transmembrane protein, putative [Tetrahymena thermophila SB210]EAS06296.1 transmembrane protein, putative [Tetrahymena thermophila SB210]|eukprot:XP_001026541.1 transmembrane protein, putative [Tetrahymena thermophila SB210]